MGQEQSYAAHRGAHVRRYADKVQDPVPYKSDGRTCDQYGHEARRSPDINSESSNESSGYRSGSSACGFRSERSCKSDCYRTSLYKNDHYRDDNKELYKPVKIPKEKRYKVQLFEVDKEEIKSSRLTGYLSNTEKAKLKAGQTPKKAGIRNYTPKILSEDEQRLKIESWI